MARAKNYRNLWDAEVGFMRPKKTDGSWAEPFDQFKWMGGYAEGGPWQCSFFAPHDTDGLASLLGGRDKFVAKLDQMLSLPPTYHGTAIHEAKEMAAEPFGQYNQGNQPGFNYLYLFAELGQPWKTEYWTRRVCAEVFNSGVDGFPGDEDNGSMASWFIFSSIGFYPSCPGSDKYILTAPLFEQVNLRLPAGKTFVINTTDNSPKNTHVLQQKLNGEKVSRIWLSHEEICRGGIWELTLGVSPK